jgi:VanZ family protein
MSIEVLDERGRGATMAMAWERGMSLIALPRKYPTGWAIAWTALLLGLCLAPESVIPDENSISIKKYIPYFDLSVHFTLFAGFVVSWLRVGGSPLRWLAVPLAGVLLAAGTEFAQSLPFIHRDANLLDAAADLAGVALGLAVWAFVCRRWPARTPEGERSPSLMG